MKTVQIPFVLRLDGLPDSINAERFVRRFQEQIHEVLGNNLTQRRLSDSDMEALADGEMPPERPDSEYEAHPFEKMLTRVFGPIVVVTVAEMLMDAAPEHVDRESPDAMAEYLSETYGGVAVAVHLEPPLDDYIPTPKGNA